VSFWPLSRSASSAVFQPSPARVKVRFVDSERLETQGAGVLEGILRRHAERQEERRRGQLAAPVDAHVDEVLGIELEVEPRPAIGDDPGGEQELAGAVRLAPVVVEEHARAAMHLRDDDTLGAVDDEGPVVGHERQVAHVDVLLLDVADAPRAGLLVDVPDDQPQRHPQRRGVGQAALLALIDVVFRLLELILHEVQRRPIGEILDREDRFERLLQAVHAALVGARQHLQEKLVGLTLHLDEVGHRGDLGNAPECLADPLACRERRRHERPVPRLEKSHEWARARTRWTRRQRHRPTTSGPARTT